MSAKQFHADVLAVVERLVTLDPSPSTELGVALTGLAAAVEAYEKAASPSETGSPLPERDLIRRLTSYIEASSLSNTDHWRISKLRREAIAYLEAPK